MIQFGKNFTKKIEFEEICKEFIFPLIGVSFGNLKSTRRAHVVNKLVEYDLDANSLFLYESINGDILSVGAIIQNESGSYGGGRGAAARKLSNYGFAIKISTDGYIECYKGGEIVFKIK